MNQTFTNEEIKQIFRSIWQVIYNNDLPKEHFTLSEMEVVKKEIFEKTGYNFTDRTYFNLYNNKGSEKDSSIEALCAYLLIKEGLLNKENLQYKEIENKAKGWEKKISDKPPLNIYSQGYYNLLNRKAKPISYKIKAKPMILYGILTFLILLLFFKFLPQNIQQEEKIFSELDSENLKIVLLPFKPDNQCTDVANSLQGIVFDSLSRLQKKYNLKILKINDLKCPSNENDARKIGRLKNADLVIWGFYETNQNQLVPKLKFSFVNAVFKKKIEENSNSIAMLRSGEFNSFNVKDILDWTFLLSMYFKRDLKSAEQYLNKVITENKKENFSPENYLFLADMTLNMGDFEKSASLIEKCLSLSETEKKFDIKTQALAKMALVQMFLANSTLSETYAEEAEQKLSKKLGEEKYSPALKELGYSFMGLQNTNKAILIFESVLELEKKSNLIDSLTLATTYFYTGYAHFFAQNLEKAERLITKAGQIAENSDDLTNSSELLGGVYEILSGIASRQKNYKKAYIIQEKSLAHSQKILPENHVNLGGSYSNLGFTQMNLGLYDKAGASFDKALSILKKTKDGYFLNGLADTYSGMGVLELKKNNLSKSISFQKMAIELGSDPRQNNPSLDKYYFRAADAYFQMAKKDSAIYFIDQSIIESKKFNKVNSLRESLDFKETIKKIRKQSINS